MKKTKKRKKNNIKYSKIVIFASLFLFACMIGRVIQLGLSSEVDGGINDVTGKLCKEAGVDVLVAGSYVFKNDIKKAVQSLCE